MLTAAVGGDACPPPTYQPTAKLPISNSLGRKQSTVRLKPLEGHHCIQTSVTSANQITLFQCNIGGDPQARLAKGSVLNKLIESRKPTFIILTETKRKRKDIPNLPNYHHYTLDPLDGSSGGIVLYYKEELSFRTSIAHVSACNSLLWTHRRYH